MSPESKILRRSIVAILAPLAGAFASPANATTYVVSSLADSGFGSLRQAMIDANASDSAADSISFSVTGTITLTSSSSISTSLPTIGAAQGALTIAGPGVSSLTITGPGNPGSFRFFDIAPGGQLSISQSTITGANTAYNGGAFNNAGSLTIDNCTISNNISGQGAVFSGYNINASLTVSNSLVTGNTADYGAGLYNQGVMTVSNSTISNNSTPGSNKYGGGLFSRTGFTITNSTISGNTSGHGGGIDVSGPPTETITITNSTIAGNSASNGDGGGIYLSGVSADIVNSTISGNSATNGGGVYADSGATVSVANSIIANSTSGGDFSGAETFSALSPATAINNLVTIGTPSWATNVSSGALNLGSLQNNGGPTSTIALGVGSVAIGAGNASISNAAPVNGLDQRGYTRSASTPSIGAYEYNGSAPSIPAPTSAAPSSGSTSGGTSITITGSGFTGTTGVTIGGAICAGLVVTSDTSITCTTPAGSAGPASVLITNGAGTNGANSLYTYTSTPPASTSTPPASIPSLSSWAQLILAMAAGSAIWWNEKKKKIQL